MDKTKLCDPHIILFCQKNIKRKEKQKNDRQDISYDLS